MKFLSWIATNWQAVLGWTTGFTLLYKGGKIFANLAVSFNDVRERFSKAEATLQIVATNHLPHLQVEMEKMNKGIAGLQICSDKGNESLVEIATILRERQY